MSLPGPRHRRLNVVLVAATIALAACDHYTAAGQTPADATPQAGVPTPDRTPVPTSAGSTPASQAICPVPRQAGIAVDTLRRADGSCVPVASAAVYRCDLDLDPMAALGLGSGLRRFMGGRFAVRLPASPAGTTPVGTGVSGRFSTGADGSLLLEGGGVTHRWLTLPPKGPGATPTLLVIGDSVADGATETLTARLSDWTIAVDAEPARGSFTGVAITGASAEIPDVVVIELGVNDADPAAFAANAAAMLADVAKARLIVWVTAHGPDPVTDHVNDAIVAAIAPVPNAVVADWDAVVPADAVSSDGVHLLDATGAPFVDFLAPLLESWREAAAGRGADRCRGQVAGLT